MKEFKVTNKIKCGVTGKFNFCILQAANEENKEKYFLVKFPSWTRDTSYNPYQRDYE